MFESAALTIIGFWVERTHTRSFSRGVGLVARRLWFNHTLESFICYKCRTHARGFGPRISRIILLVVE